MISESARHEFHRRPRERTRNVPVVPPGVNRDVTHRITGRERAGVLRIAREKSRPVVQLGFKSQPAANKSPAPNPVVAQFVIRAGVGNAKRIKIGASPEPIRFGFQRLVHQAARDFG